MQVAIFLSNECIQFIGNYQPLLCFCVLTDYFEIIPEEAGILIEVSEPVEICYI